MKKKVSIRDIAAKVGVSTALVSYVLNNKHENRIKKEVAQRIREVAQSLHYRANHLARGLKTNKTLTIGLIVADISNPFFSALARIIEDEAEKKAYTVIFGSSDESARKCSRLIEVFRDRQVDGLIISAAEGSETQIAELLAQDFPFVLIDRYFPGMPANYVAIDNFKASYTAVTHLLDQGLRRVGMITYGIGLYHLSERERGFVVAQNDRGIAVPEGYVKRIGPGEGAPEVEGAIDALLAGPEPVEAILFGSNVLSTQGLKYINSLDLEVPKDLAIVSFDESDAAGLFYAPLTYIRQPLQRIGERAVSLLLGAMGGKKEPEGILEEAAFVVGRSSLRPGA